MRENIGSGINLIATELQAKKDPQKFYEDFVRIDEEQGFNTLSKIIRLICVNKHNKDEMHKSWNKVKAYIKSKYGKRKEIKKIINEADKIKALFLDIKEQVDLLEKRIPQDLRLTIMLLITEIAIRARADQTEDPYKRTNNIIHSLNYKFNEQMQENCFDTPSFSKFLDEMYISLDESIRTITFAIKHSLYGKKKKIYPHQNIEIDWLNLFSKHLVYSVAWDMAEDIESWWIIDAVDILGGKNSLKIKVKDHVASKRLIISNKRNLSGRRVLAESYKKKYIQEKPLASDNELPPSYYLNEEEFIAASFCASYFSDQTLNDIYHGIKLSEWVRAYSVIKKVNTIFLKSKPPCRLSLAEFCHIQEIKWWENRFISYGLSKESAKGIIRYLCFSAHSNDLLDTPFVRNGDSIICLPTIASYIGAGHSILSNLKSQNHISNRGNRFEEHIRNLFIKYGIPCLKIKLCDAVLILDDVLFIFECKAYADQYEVRDHNILFNNLLSNSVSFNKNINDLLENMELLCRQFKKPKDWRPKAIYKAFIIMGKIGQAEEFNGCHVIDETLLISFLNRATFKLPNENFFEYEEKIFWEYEGEITAEKLIKLIQSPRPIEIYESECSLHDKKMRFYKLKIDYQCYLKNTPGFYVPFEEEFLNGRVS